MVALRGIADIVHRAGIIRIAKWRRHLAQSVDLF
jgi:hypothetical protein